MNALKAQPDYFDDDEEYFDNEEYSSNDEYLAPYLDFSECTICAICGNLHAENSFKGMLVCESCLESVKRYCY